jgi:hypothetical protein
MKMQIPNADHIYKALTEYNFDIGKCIDYFVEELGFDGAVVYKDPP